MAGDVASRSRHGPCDLADRASDIARRPQRVRKSARYLSARDARAGPRRRCVRLLRCASVAQGRTAAARFSGRAAAGRGRQFLSSRSGAASRSTRATVRRCHRLRNNRSGCGPWTTCHQPDSRGRISTVLGTVRLPPNGDSTGQAPRIWRGCPVSHSRRPGGAVVQLGRCDAGR